MHLDAEMLNCLWGRGINGGQWSVHWSWYLCPDNNSWSISRAWNMKIEGAVSIGSIRKRTPSYFSCVYGGIYPAHIVLVSGTIILKMDRDRTTRILPSSLHWDVHFPYLHVTDISYVRIGASSAFSVPDFLRWWQWLARENVVHQLMLLPWVSSPMFTVHLIPCVLIPSYFGYNSLGSNVCG